MAELTILATGGTIASAEGENGLEPKFSAEEMMAFVPGFTRYSAKEILKLDSSNIIPSDWKIMAQAVISARESSSGIVITHGTDTMAYTASMLTFMLMGIGVPVVITGSQLPINVIGSDGPGNLRSAVTAALSDLPGGVYVAFDNKLILGCRSTKFRTESLNAFESKNSPYVAFFKDGNMEFNPEFNAPPVSRQGPFRKLEDKVFLLKPMPGMSPRVFDYLRADGYKGIVIEAFGLGGLHRGLRDSIRSFIRDGGTVVITSQCALEGVNLELYEVGHEALDLGVVPGGDMTSEAAVTKLMWALANAEDVHRAMKTNFCGEINNV